MTTFSGRAEQFMALHEPGRPLLQPNAWDVGSARVLVAMGFEAVATTSSGLAATFGRLDGGVSLDEALEHATALSRGVAVPVAADLENGYAHDPEDVAAAVTRAQHTGLAGCSIEDYSGAADDSIYELGLARERIAAAADAAHGGASPMVLTARAENLLHGRGDLADTILRLQAYQEAGADVLFAPGLRQLADIRAVVAAVDRPVNVLALPGCPPVSELAEAGVCRISVGGAFAAAALAGLVDAATELRDAGTYGYFERVASVRDLVRAAFDPPPGR